MEGTRDCKSASSSVKTCKGSGKTRKTAFSGHLFPHPPPSPSPDTESALQASCKAIVGAWSGVVMRPIGRVDSVWVAGPCAGHVAFRSSGIPGQHITTGRDGRSPGAARSPRRHRGGRDGHRSGQAGRLAGIRMSSPSSAMRGGCGRGKNGRCFYGEIQNPVAGSPCAPCRPRCHEDLARRA